MMPAFVNEATPVPPPAYHRAQARLGPALHIDALTLVNMLHLLTLCRLAVRLVLPWDTVDNSASPCEGISGWFSPDLTGRIPQPVSRLAPPQLSYTPNHPLFFSSSIISPHFCSKFEAWRREYWVTEYFSRGPSAVRSPCCHGWGTLSVTLCHQLTTSLSWLHEHHSQCLVRTHKVIIRSPPLQMGQKL